MSAILWGLVGFLMGIVAYIAFPILVGPSLSRSWQVKIYRVYMGHMEAALRRGMLVARRLGGFDLVASEFNADFQKEETTLDGRRLHFDDTDNNRTRLTSKPFGVVSEIKNEFINPRLAEVGTAYAKKMEDNEHILDYMTRGESERVPVFSPIASLDSATRLVNLHDATRLLGGSASPGLADLAEDFTEKSQRGFNSARIVEGMTIIIAFGAGYGLVFLGMKYGGGGGGGGVGSSISLMSGVFL